ncbi:MAG: threo-3-hydroxy-L-aspartate ammonia-lyase [Cyanobacteria bacterium P01_D01_bin.44]
MFEKIQAAADRLQGYAHPTPVMTSQTLDQRLGGQVFFKCENLQKVGAFKFRGAFNAISQLSSAEREKGVITYSSGNHAQAVALVGRMLGIKTTIVMPQTAPLAKRTATEGYGAKVVLFDPFETTREALAAKVQTGQTLIPPFDHGDVIAGQGTAALELFDEVGELDALLVPCGGGGLLSGSAIVAKHLHPGCRVIGVEPELADDATRSFRTGTLQTVENPPTIADGTRSPSLGKLTFPLVLEYVDEMATVSEAAIKDAIRFLFYRLKQVVEPSGALGLAALLSGQVRAEGRVGVILSGGNIDGAMMAEILNQERPKV